MSDRPGLDDTVVDNDRHERRTLRREQPAPVEESWHDAGYNAAISVRSSDALRFVAVGVLAHLRWATDTHHGALTDQQLGQLTRGIIAGLIDAGIAPDGVEL